ncbi:hypothetical protein EI94DRAFT_1053537 [Lactarius quietus]|nr:hypothetical protein EI94DRAFT_1053537 [Lactarius quietus]
MQFKTLPRLPAPYHAPTFQKRAQGTLSTVCVRRMQTVYHKHTPETDGMILAVKFENVPANAVRTQKRSATLRAGASCVVVGLKEQLGTAHTTASAFEYSEVGANARMCRAP